MKASILTTPITIEISRSITTSKEKTHRQNLYLSVRFSRFFSSFDQIFNSLFRSSQSFLHACSFDLSLFHTQSNRRNGSITTESSTFVWIVRWIRLRCDEGPILSKEFGRSRLVRDQGFRSGFQKIGYDREKTNDKSIVSYLE